MCELESLVVGKIDSHDKLRIGPKNANLGVGFSRATGYVWQQLWPAFCRGWSSKGCRPGGGGTPVIGRTVAESSSGRYWSPATVVKNDRKT
jgi:hypothetical protein